MIIIIFYFFQPVPKQLISLLWNFTTFFVVVIEYYLKTDSHRSQMIPRKILHNTTLSVQLPYIAGHSL